MPDSSISYLIAIKTNQNHRTTSVMYNPKAIIRALIIFSLVMPGNLYSQWHDTQDIFSGKEKHEQSTIVVEGQCVKKELKIVDEEWYTIHNIVVQEILKGSNLSDTLHVWSRGGTTATMGHVFPGEFDPPIGRSGKFYLSNLNGRIVSKYGIHGFKENRISTGSNGKALHKKNLAISGFNADTLIGNSQTILTIQGSGFGSNRGSSYVSFNDWNGYHSSSWANKFNYLSWSDTEIKVEVPQCISGVVKVHLSNGSSTASSDTLFIPGNIYSEIGTPTGIMHHIADNGTAGGYEWRIASNIYSDSVLWGVDDVFQQFICASNAHYVLNTTPTNVSNDLSDGVNAITFDNTNNPLPAGTAARCNYIWYSCINNGDTLYWMSAIDIEFNSSYSTWYYGKGVPPASKGSKFRYVLMHELGHSLRLGHTDIEGESMYPIVSYLPAQNWNMRDKITRTDSSATHNAALRSSSFTFQGCGVQPITLITNACSGLGGDSFDMANAQVYPNPTSALIHISTEVPCEFVITDFLGKTLKSGKVFGPIDLSNFPAGNYILQLSTGKSIQTTRVLKL